MRQQSALLNTETERATHLDLLLHGDKDKYTEIHNEDRPEYRYIGKCEAGGEQRV